MLLTCRQWCVIAGNGISQDCHAVMKHKHYNIADYVPSIYKKEAYVECYSSMIYPANGQNMWMRTEYTDLQPPATKNNLEDLKRKGDWMQVSFSERKDK